MEEVEERLIFPHDQDKRIQQLYYDVNIHTIFNKTKLRNLKHKFYKYVNYLTKYKKNVIQPALLEYQKYKMKHMKIGNEQKEYHSYIILLLKMRKNGRHYFQYFVKQRKNVEN